MANYVITNQELTTSRVSGAEVVKITLRDIESRDEYVCYVDSSMDNFVLWEEIITQPWKGFIITGLKRKRNYGRYKNEILNADYEPIILVETADAKQLHKKVLAHWAREDFRQTPFGRLFDDKDDDK